MTVNITHIAVMPNEEEMERIVSLCVDLPKFTVESNVVKFFVAPQTDEHFAILKLAGYRILRLPPR